MVGILAQGCAVESVTTAGLKLLGVIGLLIGILAFNENPGCQ